MRIAFNPSTVEALITPPNNKDITFDLRGHNIFARGVKFCGTDTNTWRDIKINNVSIDSNTLDLRNGSNTTLTNTNGVVTINSTWRPVVDNLTSDSTTSSLSANLGRVLKALIDGKSDSGHTHDDRYLKLTGGLMSGDITFGGDNKIYWGRNTDSASISFKNNGDGDADSYMSFVTSDDGNEYFRWSHRSGSTNTEWMALRSDGLRVGGTKVSLEGHSHNDLYYTKTEVNNKLNGKSDTSHTHDDRYLKLTGGTMLGALNFANGTWNLVGDDIYMGDHNIGGQLCIMGASGTTGLSFHKCGDASIRKSITFDGNTLYMNGSCDYTTLSNLTNLLAINTVPNKTTATSIGSWSPISGRYVFHQKWTDTSTGSDNADFGIYLDGNLTANMVLDGYYNSLLGFRVIGATGGFLKANGTIDNSTYLTSHLSLSNYYTKSEVDNQLSKYKLKSSIWVPETKIICSNFRDFLNKENLHKLAPEELNLYRFFAAGDESNYSSKYNYPVVDSHAMVFSIDGNNGYIRSMNFDLRSNDVYVTSRGANGEWRSWVRLLNTSDVAELKDHLTVHLYLSNTDTTRYPLIWGGSSHNNTSDSTGEVYKSYDKLSWQTSSLTLYATNLYTGRLETVNNHYYHFNSDATLRIYGSPNSNTERIYFLAGIDNRIDDYDIPSYGGELRHSIILNPRGGFVGIGDTNPISKLTVAGSITPTTANVYNIGTSKNYYNTIYSRVLCAETTSTSIYHLIAIGYPGHDRIDFDELGGAFYFNKTSSASRHTIATITLGGLFTTDAITYGFNGLLYFNQSTKTTSGATNNANPYNDWFHIIRMNHSNANGYFVDLATAFHLDAMYFRRIVYGQDNGWRKILHDGNSYVTGGKGVINGATITQVDNADKLDGYHANGLLTALSNSDKGISITVGGTTKSVANISVNYANSAGSVAWDNVTNRPTIPNPTNYYWANVKISASSSTTTSPTVSNLAATSSIRVCNISLENGNEINSANGSLYLNYRSSGNIGLCQGGGNVGIGTVTPSHKLDVNGLVRASGFIHSDHSINDAVLLAGGAYERIFKLGTTRYRNGTSYNLAFHKLSGLCNNLVWVDGNISNSTSTSFLLSSDFYPYLYDNSPSMLTIYRMDGDNMITVNGNGIVVIRCSSYPRRVGFFYTGRA